MAAAKVSLTLDQSLVISARERAGKRGLSQYVNEALRLQLQRDRLAGLLDDLASEHGAIDNEIMEEVRRVWPDATAAQRRSA